MNGPPPATAATRVYRLLLADEIATALTTGRSVIASGERDTDDVLDMTAAALAEAGVRVLSFRPPFDGSSFIRQLANEWRITATDADKAAVMLPKGSNERFVMLFHQAQTMLPETLRHLERLAQAWPGMQMAFAGLPGIAEAIQSDEHAALRGRVSVFVEVAGRAELHDSATYADSSGYSEVALGPPAALAATIEVAAVRTPVKTRGGAARWVAALAAGCLLAAAVTAGTMGGPRLRRMADEIAGMLPASSSPSQRSARASPAAVAPPSRGNLPIPAAGDGRDREEVAVDPTKREGAIIAASPTPPNATSGDFQLGEEGATQDPAPLPGDARTQHAAATEPAPVTARPPATLEVSDLPISSIEGTSVQLVPAQSAGGQTQLVADEQPSAKQMPADALQPTVAHDDASETVPSAAPPVEAASAVAQPAASPSPAFVAPQAETTQAIIEAFQQAVPVSVAVVAPSLQADLHVPAPAAPSPLPGSPVFRVSLAMADAMTRRGRVMLDIGDVSAARLLLARAAGAGSGPAALTMGTTFDAATLDRIGAVGILPDPAQAAAWYRVAISLGEYRARVMLEALSTGIVLAGPEATPQ